MPATLVGPAFPFKGINEVAANRSQPPGTTPDALNVRPFDVFARRDRGGQRAGLSKYAASAINGSSRIQAMEQLTTALDPSTIVADTLLIDRDFSAMSDGALTTVDAPNWDGYYGSGLGAFTVEDATNFFQIDTGELEVGGSSAALADALWKPAVTLGSTYIVRLRCKVGVTASASAAIYVRCYSGNPPSPDASHVAFEVFNSGGGKNTIQLAKYTPGQTVVAGPLDIDAIVGRTTYADYELRVNGNYFEGYVNNVLYLSGTIADLSSNTRFGVSMGKTSPKATRFAVWTAKSPASLRSSEIVTVSGGSVYHGTATEGFSQAISGSGAVSSTGRTGLQAAYASVYICDGAASGYKVYGGASQTVTAWQATAGVLPGGGSGTPYAVTAIDSTNGYITATGASAAFAPNDIIEVFNHSDSRNNKTYKVTVDNGADQLTVDPVPPDDTTAGSIRLVTVGCRHNALYRGRIVMWGLWTDPQNWFMSAVGDPLDWDYFPATTTQTQAVAGNNSDAGKLGDVLTCCAPYSDDLMVMGGDHTLWIMRGDPAAGGVIDSISYETGIVGPDAYCWDSDGVFYFVGARTLWRMSVGSQPEPLSRGVLDNTFEDIDYSQYECILLWDSFNHGVHVFFAPVNQPSAGPVHVYWDKGTGGFWKDQYPAAMGPSSVLAFDADSPTDRALLLGGWDSYIRQLDDDEKADDGTAISSYCWLTPIVAHDAINVKLSDIRVIMASESDPVTMEIHAATTVEELNASATPVVSRALSAGRNNPVPQKVVGNAVNIRFSNDTDDEAWAIESITGIASQGGKHRHGRI